MEIVVCIKQVPETAEVEWDPETGSLRREGVPGVLNPTDKNALEAALQLKERHGGQVTAISMGPPQAEEVLREGLSMGADRAVLLTDPQFAGADTLATAYTLSLGIRRIGEIDLVLCGTETVDAYTGQVGPQLAEFLELPQLPYAVEIEREGDRVKIRQRLEGFMRVLEAPLPALITVEREANRPRIPPMDKIMEAYGKPVLLWDAEQLGGRIDRFGLKGSPTKTRRVYVQQVERSRVRFLQGDAGEKARALVEILKERNLIQ